MRILIGASSFDLVRADDGSWHVDDLTLVDGGRMRLAVSLTPVSEQAYDLCQLVGLPREELETALRERPILRVEIGTGGVGLGLVVQLEGGLRTLLKPQQVSPHSTPRHEVAAYRIARALGLGTVPPTVLRHVTRDELLSKLPANMDFLGRRIVAETTFDPDGGTWASVMAWAPGTTVAQVSSLAAVRQRASWLSLAGTMPDWLHGLAGEYSSAMLFDVVINNGDRWVGGNVLATADGLSSVWIDNGFAFGSGPTRSRALAALRRCQRFSRTMVVALRALDEVAVRRALASDPVLLEEAEVQAVLTRRAEALLHVEALIREHGEHAVLAFT